MTASTSTPPAVAAAAANPGILPGFGGVFRKEVIEWLRGWRAWITLIVSTLFMTLTAMNAWIQDTLAPIDPVPPPVLDPFTNVAAGVSAQMFVVIAIFVTMSLIVGERESGTLAWTASKPVSRGAIWLAKWTSATGILWLLGVILPLVATAILVTVLYGPLPVVPVLIIAVGAGLAIALFVAIGLAASTVLTSQAAVAAVGFAALIAPMIIGAVVPIEAYLPTSILGWSLAVATGQAPGVATLVSWSVTLVALVAFALRRMERMEL